MQQIRKPLPAILLRHGEAEPAAFAIEIISLLVAIRRRHRTVRMTLAAFAISGLVDRKQGALGELRTFRQDCLDDIGRHVGKAR